MHPHPHPPPPPRPHHHHHHHRRQIQGSISVTTGCIFIVESFSTSLVSGKWRSRYYLHAPLSAGTLIHPLVSALPCLFSSKQTLLYIAVYSCASIIWDGNSQCPRMSTPSLAYFRAETSCSPSELSEHHYNFFSQSIPLSNKHVTEQDIPQVKS